MARQLYQARPTVYRGVQMRSRLEAQAAESVPSVDQGLDVGALFCKGCERCSEDV